MKLLADENIPKKLVVLLKESSVDITRLHDLSVRGISDQEIANVANQLRRTILTRNSDFTAPHLLPLIRNGVIYISYQPSKNEIPKLAKRISDIAKQLKPKPGLLIIIEREYVEVYD